MVPKVPEMSMVSSVPILLNNMMNAKNNNVIIVIIIVVNTILITAICGQWF